MADDKAREAGLPPAQKKIERKPVGGGSTPAAGSAAAQGPASASGNVPDDPPPAYEPGTSNGQNVTGDLKRTSVVDHGGSDGSEAASAEGQRQRSRPASIQIDKTKPEDFDGEIATTNELPSPEQIKQIDNYIVLDKDGKSHTFKSLYSGTNVARRVLIIFVRHFFCGVSYVMQ